MQWYGLSLCTEEAGLENFRRNNGALGTTQV